MEEVWEKYNQLLEQLRSLGRILVAFSGGVDSSFLLKAAIEGVGVDNVLAVTADSETYPMREREEAAALAKDLGARHEIIATSELSIPGYAENPVNRCYFCKFDLFSHLLPIAKEQGYDAVAFGAIADDLGDFRPGLQAAKDKGVYAPLQDVMLYKKEIRLLSKNMGLSTWDKPSLACLSSRIPYGEKITKEKLSAVEQAEMFLTDLGFRQVRVRHHDGLARIEVPPETMTEVLQYADLIVTKLKKIGYRFVSLDLQGYRTGSLNESLAAHQKKTSQAHQSHRETSHV
ncbi:ATP-dependent sacrificial sulfur transferase LarE [Alicyclobacillus sp. SO9]|uniref:ATP-dependent sacrificial sulfur transferase LarE n=1 Tax=Alicyclobacillus sp. SO9 TaxID=2665646 RepID=UPI00351C7D60